MSVASYALFIPLRLFFPSFLADPSKKGPSNRFYYEILPRSRLTRRGEKKKQALKQISLPSFSFHRLRKIPIPLFSYIYNVYIYFFHSLTFLSSLPRIITIPLASPFSLEIILRRGRAQRDVSIRATKGRRGGVAVWLKRDDDQEKTKRRKETGELPSYATSLSYTFDRPLSLRPIEFLFYSPENESIVFFTSSKLASPFRSYVWLRTNVRNRRGINRKRRGKFSFIAPRYFAAWSNPFGSRSSTKFVRHSTRRRRRRRSMIHV